MEMPVYQSHWGLRESPYRDGFDRRFFYQSPVHSEALARLHFLVEQRRRVGLLLGGEGTGKTLLLELFGAELRRAGQAVARVDLVGIDSRELLWQVASQWGVNPTGRTDEFGLWRLISDRIQENRWQHVSTVLLLDNADQAVEDVLTQVLRLVQCDPSADCRLTAVLSARQIVLSPAANRLLDLASLRIDLEPWDQDDTSAYLKRSLAQAGRKAPTFGDQAIARLYQLTQGVPRHVNQLADLALLAGAGQQLSQIDSATIEAVYRELGTLQMPAPVL